MWKFGQKLAVRKFSAKIRTAPSEDDHGLIDLLMELYTLSN